MGRKQTLGEGYWFANENAVQLAIVKLSNTSSKIFTLPISEAESRVLHLGSGKTAKYVVTMKRHQFAKATAPTVAKLGMTNGVATKIKDAATDAAAATFKR